MTKKRDDLRALLEKIAATAGDPPEHGLDGVKARRRRRTRHRRGAVATAMALAVGGTMTVSWLSGQQHSHDVAADSSTDGSQGQGLQAELPERLDMTCFSERIDVPDASIATQADGLHLRVVNKRGVRTDVWVRGEAWESGSFSVPTGPTNLVLKAPPGTLTVGCDGGVENQQRQVDLVDAAKNYSAPGLDCGGEDLKPPDPTLRNLNEQVRDLPEAARLALGAERLRGFQLEPFSGYREAGYDSVASPNLTPTVAVTRLGETVALIRLVGTPREDPFDLAGKIKAPPPTPVAPWTAVRLVESCSAFYESPGAGPEQRGPS